MPVASRRSRFVTAPTYASQINGSGIGDVFAAGHPARRASTGYGDCVARRHDDMLDGPQRLEAELLGELRDRDRVARVRPTVRRWRT